MGSLLVKRLIISYYWGYGITYNMLGEELAHSKIQFMPKMVQNTRNNCMETSEFITTMKGEGHTPMLQYESQHISQKSSGPEEMKCPTNSPGVSLVAQPKVANSSF